MSTAAPTPTPSPSPEPASAPARGGPLGWLRRNLGSLWAKVWWFHSFYALGLGVFIVIFAQKGFDNARWLTLGVGLVWLLLVLAFRFFGSGRDQRLETKGAKVRFFVMTYVLKNLYQGMLFFLLPFYWKSTSLDSDNRWFVVVLALCAFLSTMDVIFDKVLMRWRTLASGFYAVTLFAAANLMIPALLPGLATAPVQLTAAAIAVAGFFTMHVPLRALRQPRFAALLVGSLAAGMALVWAGRAVIPPVPMHVAAASVGPEVLPDGRLKMQVTSLHTSLVDQMYAVTDVVLPGGAGDRLHHVWRHDDRVVQRLEATTERAPGPRGTLRLSSRLSASQLPERRVGPWTVDVETADGQLVGRARFEVIE